MPAVPPAAGRVIGSRPGSTLLIQLDQWPWFGLGLLGHPDARTPHLDALVREGGATCFADCTVQSPICLPSRLSMLSGRTPASLRQFGFCGLCPPGIAWLPGVMRDAGCRTGAFGKFHTLSMGQDGWGFDAAAPTLGEDEDLARPAGDTYRAYCARAGLSWPTDQMHGHDPYGGCEITGRGAGARISPHADPAGIMAERWAARSAVPEEHGLERWTADRGIDFLRSCAASAQPFFAWISFDRPHFPTTLSDGWWERCRPDLLHLPPLPDAAALGDLPAWLFGVATGAHEVSALSLGPERLRRVLATWWTLVEQIDAEIGRILAALRAGGLDDRTTVVVCADHGDDAGVWGLYDKHRQVASEPVTRTALLIRPPSVRRPAHGRIVREPVELLDVMPTVCALAGVPGPASAEGRDLSPLLDGRTAGDPLRTVVCEDRWRMAIRRAGWRLVFDASPEEGCQLHHLPGDPWQFRDRSRDPACAGERLELKRRLLAHLLRRTVGGWTAADAAAARRALRGEGRLPLHTMSNDRSRPTLHVFRAAAMVKAGKNADELLVLLDEEGGLQLFPAVAEEHRALYRTADQAIPLDPARAEPLLDAALRIAMGWMASVSTLFPQVAAGRSGAAAANAALSAAAKGGARPSGTAPAGMAADGHPWWWTMGAVGGLPEPPTAGYADTE